MAEWEMSEEETVEIFLVAVEFQEILRRSIPKDREYGLLVAALAVFTIFETYYPQKGKEKMSEILDTIASAKVVPHQ